MPMQENTLYGKYRARVTHNDDPEKRARLQVIASVLPGLKQIWALPSLPYAGKGVGMFMVPPIDAMVWLEFEGGDVERPIWTGCFWDKAQDSPAYDHLEEAADANDIKLLVMPGIFLSFNHQDEGRGGLSLKLDKPASDRPITMELNHHHIQITTATNESENDTAQRFTMTLGDQDTQSIVLQNNPDQKLVMDSKQVTLSYQQDKPIVLSLKDDAATLEFSAGHLLIDNNKIQAKHGGHLTIGGGDAKLEHSGAKIALSSNKISLNNNKLEIM